MTGKAFAILANNSSIRIKNKSAVEAKLTQIESDGISKVHVISDFDMTITRYWHNGVRSPSTHSILTRSDRVSDEFRTQTDVLYKKYYPMEISTTLSFEQKYAAMAEWWTHAHRRIVELHLSKKDLHDIVATTSSPVVFRDGVQHVIEASETLGVPFLVFSAGIYDVIKEILEQEGLKRNNVHIVSNRMKFDEKDVCIGFEDPMIHTFNKNEAGVHGAPYQAAIDQRPNIILMGDSLGDLRMKEGVVHSTSLTIGFLNHDPEVYLDEYLDAYDIVVLDDTSIVFVWIGSVASSDSEEPREFQCGHVVCGECLAQAVSGLSVCPHCARALSPNYNSDNTDNNRLITSRNDRVSGVNSTTTPTSNYASPGANSGRTSRVKRKQPELENSTTGSYNPHSAEIQEAIARAIELFYSHAESDSAASVSDYPEFRALVASLATANAVDELIDIIGTTPVIAAISDPISTSSSSVPPSSAFTFSYSVPEFLPSYSASALSRNDTPIRQQQSVSSSAPSSSLSRVRYLEFNCNNLHDRFSNSNGSGIRPWDRKLKERSSIRDIRKLENNQRYLLKYKPAVGSQREDVRFDIFEAKPADMMISVIFKNLEVIRVKYLGSAKKNDLDRYREFLHHGYENYVFFSFTRTMMDSKDCIMVDRNICSVLRENSGLNQVIDVAKFVKYSGLLLNELGEEIQEIAQVNVGLDRDIRRNGFNFSDGCGRVSRDIVRLLLPDVLPVPSVLQIRAPGIKGVLVVDPSLSDKTVWFRKSMQKLDILNLKDDKLMLIATLQIAVVGYSKPVRCQSLNAQVLALLLERGLNPETIIQKDRQYKAAVTHALADVAAAFDFLHICGHDSRFAKLHEILNEQHLTQKSALQRFWHELRSTHSSEISQWRRGNHHKQRKLTLNKHNNHDFEVPNTDLDVQRRIRIPLRDSTLLYGICDNRNVLRPGTCRVHITLLNNTEIVLNGRIAVMRNPCYHPGDIIILKAVDAPELSHIHNAIVFSVMGVRPDADKCAGGDLDGDQFRVIWDKEIIASLLNVEPFDYNPDRVKTYIADTVRKLGVDINVGVGGKGKGKRTRRDDTESSVDEGVTQDELINFLIGNGPFDNMVGLIDSIFVDFQKYEFVPKPDSLLNRTQVVDFLTALFSAGVDAMGINVDAVLKATRKEIAKNQSGEISKFRRLYEEIIRNTDATAQFAKLHDKPEVLLPLFVDSVNDEKQHWSVLGFVENYRPQLNQSYAGIKSRILKIGRSMMERREVRSFLNERFMSHVSKAVSNNAFQLCSQELQALEARINESITKFEDLAANKIDEADIDLINKQQKQQQEFERLFNQHANFGIVGEKLGKIIENQALSSGQRNIPDILNVETILLNELEMLKGDLPIYASRQALMECIDENQVVLILSSTGSGKSSCTPNFIVNELFFRGNLSPSKPVIVAQPRRNATTALADYLASSRRTQVGESVGSHIGKSRARVNKDRTIIICVTYGILVSYAQRDPYLRNYSVIILDEVHENSSDLLFLFGIVKNAMLYNKELKLVLMSAAVESDKIKMFFGEACKIITVEGKIYSVEPFYVGNLTKNPFMYIKRALKICEDIHKMHPVEGNSDILVFLATKKDIDAAMSEAENSLKFAEKLKLHPFPLHSKMSEAKKKFIINRGPLKFWEKLEDYKARAEYIKSKFIHFDENDEEDLDTSLIDDRFDANKIKSYIENMDRRVRSNMEDLERRVIFSTNIAETSLTIPRIGFVVDCGLHFSVDVAPIMKVQDCKLIQTTKVSAVQRMGRAGRLGPGKCYRLYSYEEHEAFPLQTYKFPTNFDMHLLSIIEIFEDLRKFSWFKEPSDEERGWAYLVLEQFGFLKEAETGSNQVITPRGQFAAELNRYDVPASVALFLMRVWSNSSRICGVFAQEVKENCATVAAFMATKNSNLFKPQFSYENFTQSVKEYFPMRSFFRSRGSGGGGYEDESVCTGISSTLSKLNMYRAWVAIGNDLSGKEKFCREFCLDGYEMNQLSKTRELILEQMENKQQWLNEVMGLEGEFDGLPTLKDGPMTRKEQANFILDHLTSACFTNLGYYDPASEQVTLVNGNKPVVAKIGRREAKMFGPQDNRCALVLFHSLSKQLSTSRWADNMEFNVSHIDPLPWAWPKGIPSFFITQYLQYFPHFPS
ncbi:5'-nucleotidase, cytosolic III [Physocladia obscura]|uniref:5'-nucleotidase n=1 Tax=Physocladia obscura TaxID=109957 RepID=A0AAD5XIS7_9FUNG|nr:5'-nucleotidase, cytosolic III [Physocladia obscura]